MHTRTRRLLVWTLVVVALGAVALAYLQPEMAFTLANQIWNCF
jgi:hypothetical protein